ncbi:MAG: NADH:flavin oxidoreductase/NADH oxidase [Sterolibacterium sp.]|jgi:2,4-dienoyl-CoA reductase-like NADH-dependent reductase (Old Yellow Enzyme family)
MAHLFEPLQLRKLVLPNRIGIPPMCQYSALDGVAQDWHFIHYGSRAVGGAGLIVVEATAVSAEGRISPGDMGLWQDQQIEPLARIVAQMSKQGTVPCIQLAHAGRKASVGLGWQAQRTLTQDEHGWPTLAPSAVAFSDDYAIPQELHSDAIRALVAKFADAARRARSAGFQVAEIHAAHGYLLHEFLSPLSNRRKDAYGGSFENRIRIVVEVASAVRAVWPDDLPLLLRLSATDWLDGGWCIEESVELSRKLKECGVDLVDVSSGGNAPAARIPAGPGFQSEFAARIRREAGIATAAVGMITSPAQADHVIRSGQADLVLVGREVLRDPYWPLHAAQTLGHNVAWPNQYLRAAPSGAVGR